MIHFLNKLIYNVKKSNMESLPFYKRGKSSIHEENSKLYSDWNNTYDEIKRKAYDKFISSLKNQGDGARGIVTIGYEENSGIYTSVGRTSSFHAINYEVKNGEVVFYDAQTYSKHKRGITVRGIDYDDVDPREYMYMRTDNLEVNDNITSAVISRSKDK